MRYCQTVSTLILAAGLAVTGPALAQAPSLHDRIQTADKADPELAYQPDGEARAKQLYDEAATARGLSPDDRALAARIYAGAIYEKGDVQGALTILNATVTAYDAAGLGDSERMGELLRDQSIYMVAAGDVEGGLAVKQKALALVSKYKGADSPEVGVIMCSTAHAYGLVGRLFDALSYYDAGLARMSTDRDSDGRYRDPANYSAYLGNYAGQLRLAGDPEKSLVYSHRALDVAWQMPEGDRSVSWGMFNIASSLLDLGRYSEAESLYRQALDYTVKYGGKVSYETGSYSYNLARALIRQGKYEEGEALLLNAVDILKQVQTGNSPYLSGVVWNILGQTAYEQGHLDQAAERDRESLRILDGLGKRGEAQAASARTDLATVLLVQRDFTTALAQVDQALDYYRRERPPYEKARVAAEMLRALILSRQGGTSQALAEGRSTADAMEAHLRAAGTSRFDQVDVALVYGLAYTRLADIALAAGDSETAFRAGQLAAYTEVAATSQSIAARAAIADPAAAELIRHLDDLKQKRMKLDRARTFALGKSADEVKRLDGDIAAADADLDKTAGDLAATFPAYDQLSQPHPLTLTQARAALQPGHALVMPLASDDTVLTLVVTPEGLTSGRSPMLRLAVNRDVRTLRAAIEHNLAAPTGFDRTAAWELGQAFFPPVVQTALHGSKVIDVLGAGPIMNLPLGVLLLAPPQGDDGDSSAVRRSAWLIRSFAVEVHPVLLGDAPPPRKGPGGFAGIGAPITGDSATGGTGATPRGPDSLRFPELPRAADELKTMDEALNLPDSRLITGALATEAAIKSAPLDRYRVIAFATHGLVSGDLQAVHEPALVMTPPTTVDGEDDGLLTASEVAGLRLDADWVILSACNTGSGRESGAAGYSGLAKAFLQAGARNVLVSLWPVRDDVAARISVATVRGYAHGKPEAVALQKAVLDLLDDPSVPDSADPAIWAPFSLVTR